MYSAETRSKPTYKSALKTTIARLQITRVKNVPIIEMRSLLSISPNKIVGIKIKKA